MFKFPKGYGANDKKYFNQYYSVYQNSKDFIKSLFSHMGEINDYYPFDAMDMDFYPLSLDATCYIARDLLQTEFPYCLLELFDRMIQENRIFFFDGTSTELLEKYGETDFVCGVEDYLGKNTPIFKKTENSLREYIYAPILEEVDDVYGVIHEINHFSYSEFSTAPGEYSWGLLCESLSIYSEFITLVYFLEHFPERSSYFESFIDRYETITDDDEEFLATGYDLSKQKYEVNIFEQFQYVLGLLIASKLFYDYNQDPEWASGEYNFFSNCLMEEDFNYIMKGIDMPIRLCEGVLSFTKNGLEKCLFYYEWALNYVHKNYLKTQNSNQKEKIKF